ncbi:MAG: asparagine synthase (glutamine-hydrolyzing) [Candidatus Omnitrophica bacterium]|nr:asparagine synthase (glutamine-hydrolyzing) [Candidatus Omnitrophota bacterium]
MCGLAGVLHWDGEPVDPVELEGMARSLNHRGPDERNCSSPSQGVGLAHTRLRVIDLSAAAAQPMRSASGRLWLVYNGEIYNFRELRRELESMGNLFRSRSDTEVLLKAYEAWGTEAFRKIDGMFAAAFWDSTRRELTLLRDRTGKKPLFYWTDGRCLAFGSEMKALLIHPHVPCEVNEPALPFLLAFGYPPAPQTCFRQIRQVPAGSFLRFQAQGPSPTPRPYWELRFEKEAGLTRGEAKERLRGLLTEAVRRRLISDVPLGAFLSGGLDSTIVVGLMSRISPQPVKTFSIGFEGDPRFNETGYAEEVSGRFRTKHTVFTVTPQSFDLLEKLVWHHDQPFGDSSALPAYLLSKMTRQQVTVALTGDGGDENFAGYLRFLAALWSEKIPGPLLGCAASLLRGLPSGNERSWMARIQRFSSKARFPMPERYLRWMAYFDEPSQWLSNGQGDPKDRFLAGWIAPIWKRSGGWSLLSRLLHFNLQGYLPDDLLVKLDRCSMAHGLEVRSPFLDRALLEFSASLPDEWKASGMRTKVLLRETFSDLLPPSIQRRGKMGFGVPLGSWFRTRWRGPLRELLLSPGCRSARYLKQERIAGLIRQHEERQRDAGHPLWLLLTLEVWLRQIEGLRSRNALV